MCHTPTSGIAGWPVAEYYTPEVYVKRWRASHTFSSTFARLSPRARNNRHAPSGKKQFSTLSQGRPEWNNFLLISYRRRSSRWSTLVVRISSTVSDDVMGFDSPCGGCISRMTPAAVSRGSKHNQLDASRRGKKVVNLPRDKNPRHVPQ